MQKRPAVRKGTADTFGQMTNQRPIADNGQLYESIDEFDFNEKRNRSNTENLGSNSRGSPMRSNVN